ncbi:hypothetical protein PVAP13_1KG207677 [Panicum virgatum]|uniref:Uncharacterized protein n=1 Tax=Panicum virgatum TaxID=38727 RepID=A0A8T0XPG6_PANVG|nr:hypothetical protein PVAP13_1KG207677 [Panicum virgatum]
MTPVLCTTRRVDPGPFCLRHAAPPASAAAATLPVRCAFPKHDGSGVLLHLPPSRPRGPPAPPRSAASLFLWLPALSPNLWFPRAKRNMDATQGYTAAPPSPCVLPLRCQAMPGRVPCTAAPTPPSPGAAAPMGRARSHRRHVLGLARPRRLEEVGSGAVLVRLRHGINSGERAWVSRRCGRVRHTRVVGAGTEGGRAGLPWEPQLREPIAERSCTGGGGRPNWGRVSWAIMHGRRVLARQGLCELASWRGRVLTGRNSSSRVGALPSSSPARARRGAWDD